MLYEKDIHSMYIIIVNKGHPRGNQKGRSEPQQQSQSSLEPACSSIIIVHPPSHRLIIPAQFNHRHHP